MTVFPSCPNKLGQATHIIMRRQKSLYLRRQESADLFTRSVGSSDPTANVSSEELTQHRKSRLDLTYEKINAINESLAYMGIGQARDGYAISKITVYFSEMRHLFSASVWRTP
jgi:hypothetical protein